MHLCAVTTVEGIGSTQSKLHKVQEAIVKNHGSQCGFCTPGIVMSMYTLIRNCKIPTQEMINRALQGNLCRCTGYRPIIEGFKIFTIDSQPLGCPKGENCCKNKKCDSEVSSLEIPKSDFVPEHASQEPIFPAELKIVASKVGCHGSAQICSKRLTAGYAPYSRDL